MNALVNKDEWYTDDKIALLKETYAKDLSKKQFEVYLEMARAQDLNPFTKEIYGLVVGGKPVLITSIAGFRKIAHRSGDYAGCKIVVNYDNDKIHSATAVVKKIVKGQVCDFEAEVIFKEFNLGRNNWKTMPTQMIKKVAESHALRMAFPALQNTYEEAEVDAIRNAGPKVSARTVALNDRFATEDKPDVPQYDEIDIEPIKNNEKMEVE